MHELKNRLEALCIFRELLRKPAVAALLQYLKHPTVSDYAEFVSQLYDAEGGNISRYIQNLCDSSVNVYVRTCSKTDCIPEYLQASLLEELKTLQSAAELTPETLRTLLDYEGFLPSFGSEPVDLTERYLSRTRRIGQCGYGIFAGSTMFSVNENAEIVPVRNADRTELSQLIDYTRERQILIDNTRALVEGKPASNILLTGDAGTGKSSSVKAVVNAFRDKGLRMVEVHTEQLRVIPKLIDTLSDNPLKFILFIDDISFSTEDGILNILKAVLEGSVTAKPDNIVIYATSNRRHIVREKFSDREGDDIHRNDTMQELFSLSERFGIHIRFSHPDKKTFLHIVHSLAEKNGIDMPEEMLDQSAERFALERGGRSARLAKQFIDRLKSGV